MRHSHLLRRFYRRLPLRLIRLEDRLAPSAVIPRETPAGGPMAALPTLGPTPVAEPAFDVFTGRGLPDNRARISPPLLRLYNSALDARAARTAIPANDELLQVNSAGEVMVRIMAHNVSGLEPQLGAIGFRKIADRPEYFFTEGWLPVLALPAAEALQSQGLIGVTPIRQPQTGLGLVTSQADWAFEADRTRSSGPEFANGAGVPIGIMSDSFNTRVAPITTAAQDIANGDLPAGGVTVLQEGPAASSDEGRAMLQLVHDVATGSPLSFSSVFFGEADFANQIKALADPAIGNCKVLADDIFYFEEPMYQDGVIAQAIDNVVNTRSVPYFALAGNHANTGYENVGWTEVNTDPFISRTFDFDPGAGVDTRLHVQIATTGFARMVLQWDDPFYTAAGVDTDLDIFLLRSDTGAVVASATDSNIVTQVPSDLLSFTNNTGQTEFDVIIRRFAGPNPGRFKFVHLGNGSPINITEFFDANVPTATPHSAISSAEGVGAVAYFDRPNPEPFTGQGGNIIVFTPAGVPIAPVSRTAVYIAGLDNTDTTFFGSDSDGNGFPNFSGTSAATPNVAALAALVLQVNPTFGPFSVYSRLEGTADDVYTAGFDNKTGAGLANAYNAIVGSPRARETNMTDGFESSILDPRWETRSTGAGRIEVTTANGPAVGTYHVTLDCDDDGVDSLNELILHVNLANVKNAVLTFQQKEFADEDNAMPASFVGSGNFDGVALSTDGNNWYRLVSLTGAASTGAYQNFSFNLHKIAADNGLNLGPNTRIKFQQFDNFGIATDGMAFDAIQVFRTGTVSGIDYDDTDQNGSQNGAEPGRPDQIVYVDSNFNNQFDYGAPITFAAPQLPVLIEDLKTVRVPLTVSGFGGTISDLDVTIDLTHTWDSDLEIALLSPSGTRVYLSRNSGGSGDNFTNTTFDDEAATSITVGVAPFTGRFVPQGILSAFDGQALSGTWYLEVADEVGGDSGVINSWSLTLSRSFNSADTPIATIDNGTIESKIAVGGLASTVSDINVTVNLTHPFDAAVDLFLIGPNATIVELSTDNGGGGANYTGTTFDDESGTDITLGVAPFNGRFRPEGSLATLDGISPNGTWTLRVVDDDGFGDVGSLVSWSLEIGRSFQQDVAPIALADAATTNTSLPVAGLTGAILDVDVSLNINHTWDSDLDVFLTSPAGTKVELFTDVGGSADNFVGTRLDDNAFSPIATASAPFTGTFRPEGLLSAFNGENGNGNWTLTLTDDTGTDAGTLVDWSLSIRSLKTAAGTSPVAITDKQRVFASAGFSDVTGVVNDVNVTLDLTHTWDSDLEIYLISPLGTRVELSTNNGGSGDNYTNTTFDDEAATTISGAVAPFTGTFRPEGQLSLFDGLDPNGLWTLEISDVVSGDTGTLNSWSITLSTGEQFAITGAKGEYTLPNLGAGTHRIREVLSPSRVRTEPIPDTYSLTLDNDTNTNFTTKNFGSYLDVTAPSVTGISLLDPTPTNAATVRYIVDFSEPVIGLSSGNLSLNVANGATISTITGGPSSYVVTVATGGDTTMYLDLVNNMGLTDLAGNFVLAPVFSTTPYVIDKTGPTVTDIKIGDGTAQRSRVTELTVTFSELVNLTPTTFQLARTGPGAPMADVALTVDTTGSTPTQTIAKLTFSGALSEFTSLIDGKYTFTVSGTQYSDLAGNAGANNGSSFHRLFGDSDGDNDVDTTDFGAFRAVFGGTSSIFDFDNDGDVDTSDFGAFRGRFGASV